MLGGTPDAPIRSAGRVAALAELVSPPLAHRTRVHQPTAWPSLRWEGDGLGFIPRAWLALPFACSPTGSRRKQAHASFVSCPAIEGHGLLRAREGRGRGDERVCELKGYSNTVGGLPPTYEKVHDRAPQPTLSLQCLRDVLNDPGYYDSMNSARLAAGLLPGYPVGTRIQYEPGADPYAP